MEERDGRVTYRSALGYSGLQRMPTVMKPFRAEGLEVESDRARKSFKADVRLNRYCVVPNCGRVQRGWFSGLVSPFFLAENASIDRTLASPSLSCKGYPRFRASLVQPR